MMLTKKYQSSLEDWYDNKKYTVLIFDLLEKINQILMI